MQALVTGFEPFGSERVNPAQGALGHLPPRLGRVAIGTQILPAVFGEALDALETAIRETTPDIVLCVGLAGGRAALSLERVAINIDDARIPDNKGRQPIDLPVVAGGPAAYFATLPIKAVAAALREAGLPAIVSNSAGTFVCNQGILRPDASRRDPATGFARRVSACPLSAEPGGAAGRRTIDGARRHRARHRDRSHRDGFAP